jgi:hypothetical protein
MLPLQKRCSNFNQDTQSTRVMRFCAAPFCVQIVSVSNLEPLKINHLQHSVLLTVPGDVQIVTVGAFSSRFLATNVQSFRSRSDLHARLWCALQQVIQEPFDLEGNGSPEIDVAEVHRSHAAHPVIANGMLLDLPVIENTPAFSWCSRQ